MILDRLFQWYDDFRNDDELLANLYGVSFIQLMSILEDKDLSQPFDISVEGMASWTAEASGFVTITYDYVPEPSAFIPMLGGLAAFALVGRRRLREG